MSDILEEPVLGQNVHLAGGGSGVIKSKIMNFTVPLWEITLANGKTVTEARYRFDLVPSFNPPQSVQTESSKQSSNEHIIDDDDDNDLAILYDCVMSQTSETEIVSLINAPPAEVIKEINNKCSDQKSSKRQFLPVTEDTVDSFVIEQENKSTARKTLSDMRTLTQFFDTKNEKRNIYEIPPNELSALLSQFFVSVRKSDGEDYEPSSLRGMMCSFDRVLRRHNYGLQISNNSEFGRVRDVLAAKQTQLKKDGKGNTPNQSEPLLDSDIDKMYENGQLGLNNPTTLLHTIWFFNTIFFGMRGVTEHYDMKWGDIKLCTDSNNLKYLEMNERNTKTRTGRNPRDKRSIAQRAFQNPEQPEKCPVQAYLLYKSMRPINYSKPEDPFYIQENTNLQKSQKWFKSQRVGINKLGSFMKMMALTAELNPDDEKENDNMDGKSSTKRRLTNHSARRFMLQKLDDKGVEHNHIKQISGHKNIQSVANYSKLNSKKHKEITATLLNTEDACDKLDYLDAQTLDVPSLPVTENRKLQAHSVPFRKLQNPVHTMKITRTETEMCQRSVSPQSGSLFGGPIYGGTFNVTINKNVHVKRRRAMVIDSDSESDD